MRRRAILSGLLAGAVLQAGCAGLPAARVPPAPLQIAPQTGAIAMDPAASWPADHWWQVAGDEGLNRLMELALAGAPSLDQARSRLERAEAMRRSAQAGLGPGVQLDASAAESRVSENGMAPPNFRGTWNTNASVGASFSWAMDFWGVRRDQAAAADAGVAVARAEQAAARLALQGAIARTWAGLARAEALVSGGEEIVAGRRTILALHQERNAAGIPAAVQRARQNLAEAERELDQRRLSVRTLRLQLAALSGQPPEAAATLASPALGALPEQAVPQAVPLDLVARRPDVAAALARVAVAQRQEAAARGAFYPNIAVSGSVGVQSFGLGQLLEAGSFAPSVGPALHLPLFDGGRLRADLAGRQAETDTARSAYEEAVLTGLRETAAALATQATTRRATGQAWAQADAATIQWAHAQEKFARGIISRIELLEAREAAIAAARPLSESPGRELEAVTDVVLALGGGPAPATTAAPPAISAPQATR